MVFVIERRSTKFLPTKQYRIVPGYGLVYRDHENFSTNWPKTHCSRKVLPREKYPLFGIYTTEVHSKNDIVPLTKTFVM